ncbi:glycoside hydrolase superfamily [Catenaria anguillulae PL171]|uniref:Glycoside hydrolase superfamily n=1 Tax=Catenaria anguillulae PL171 TaxID=765915 RepID=A0A1Y2HY42_9FUNG|nr:glycoside hydrolase superfamily [Catenaria anguillulae PL171]
MRPMTRPSPDPGVGPTTNHPGHAPHAVDLSNAPVLDSHNNDSSHTTLAPPTFIHHQTSTSSLTSPLLPGPSSRTLSFRPHHPSTMGPLPPPAKDSVSAAMALQKKRQRNRRCIFVGTFVALALIAGGVTAYFTVFRNKGGSSSASTNGGNNGPVPSGFPSNPADRNPTVTDLSRAKPRVTAMPQIQFPISEPVAVPMDLVPTGKQFGNGIVWGHHIWGDNYLWAPTIKEIQERKGYTPGALGGFYHLDAATGIDHPDWFLSHAKQAAEAQSWFFVTLEPRDQGLDIPSATLDKVVELLRRASVDIGATVVLRWAHEMNGAWYPWVQQPLKFIQVWRDLHARLKKAAPKVTMVWSPNIGQFDATRLKRERGSAEFAAMDTNKDGTLDERDDPYTPYWPGKDYVDYIGISFFWFGPTWDQRTNALPPADMATTRLTRPFDILKFARDQGLPFVVSETGGVFYSDAKVAAGPGEVALKQAWWRMLMAIPDVAMVVYFDFIKREDGVTVNSALTNVTAVIDAFKTDSASRPLVFAPKP